MTPKNKSPLLEVSDEFIKTTLHLGKTEYLPLLSNTQAILPLRQKT